MISTHRRTRTTAAASTPRHRPTVFIASSQEARERGILHTVIEGLHENFTPRPWDSAFPPDTEFTLQTLLRLAREVDAAILICAHDDVTNRRGTISAAARDNVHLEYGLFLAALGMNRVSVLWEEGVSTPSDVRGLNLRFFKSDGHKATVEKDALLRSSLERCVQQVAESWAALEPRQAGARRFRDGGAAVTGTLEHADGRIREIAAKLEAFEETGQPYEEPFIRFDSNRLALRAYRDGLEAVRHRFWTTTFLTSGFWAKQDADVLDVNKAMLRRIGPAGGSVKRLFLLDVPPAKEIDRLRQRVVYLRQAGATREMEELWSDLQSLRHSFKQLTDLKCEVRVVHDRGSLAAKLPEQLRVKEHDSEIALYDDFRLDVFDGGRMGAVSSVNVFTPAYRRFDTVREHVESYFERLWEAGKPGMEFIQRLEQAYVEAERRIDYTSNWLALYEYALEGQDQELKTAECKRVVEVLDALGRLGGVRDYLDIGSCTGRYPRKLRHHVAGDGRILGIDMDIDCIWFARNHPELRAEPDPRISFELVDFTSEDADALGRFDLITCMMSTLSHFGVNRDARADDTLQRALQRVRALMAPDGVFMCSVYSEQACDELDLLNIYQKQEKERLAAGTPRHVEMRQRLQAAGLRVVMEPKPDLRLDMYVCQPAS